MSALQSTQFNPRVKDLTGMVFGLLTVLSFTNGRRRGSAYWICKCECGKEAIVLGYSLETGNTKSCGCLRKSLVKTRFIKHGHRETRTYKAWMSMKTRCRSEYQKRQNYYDRGITVCERWEKYENFLFDMGECPESLELDRIDNNKGYEPGNCRWTDEFIQARNKRNIKYYKYQEQSMILTDWAKQTGIDRKVLSNRITKHKWSFEKSITTPVRR